MRYRGVERPVEKILHTAAQGTGIFRGDQQYPLRPSQVFHPRIPGAPHHHLHAGLRQRAAPGGPGQLRTGATLAVIGDKE